MGKLREDSKSTESRQAKQFVYHISYIVLVFPSLFIVIDYSEKFGHFVKRYN